MSGDPTYAHPRWCFRWGMSARSGHIDIGVLICIPRVMRRRISFNFQRKLPMFRDGAGFRSKRSTTVGPSWLTYAYALGWALEIEDHHPDTWGYGLVPNPWKKRTT